jgi:rhodanese-related sulfurtransferase
VGTAIVRAGDIAVARTGVTGADARDAASVHVHVPSHDAFFPERNRCRRVDLRPIDRSRARRGGRRTHGRRQAHRRARHRDRGGLTVEQLASLDLAYAPPYSAARDPVNVAGTVAAAARQGLAVPWSAADLQQHRPTLTVIDVRSDAERQKGTIEGAQGLSLTKLRTHPPAATARVVFVSETGRRSYLAARIAQAAGVREPGYLSGGLRSWVAAGYAVSKKGGRR